jgi:hypothetical protein
LKVDALLVSAKLTAIEDVEDLVAFTAGRCPINDQQSLRLALEAQFLFHLALAARRWWLPRLDVTARDVPAVAVGLVNQQDAVAINEQCPGGDPGRGELGCRITSVDN